MAVARDSQLLVAEEAWDMNPAAIVNSVKTCITKRQEWVDSADGSSRLNADEVIVAILKELALRARAERLPIADPNVTRLGCPAMWDAPQRERLRGLAERAGFAVGPATLIDEPIAAGLTWIENQSRLGRYLEDARVLVFDMGGGTLDVALLDVTSGPRQEPAIYVMASEGVDEAGDTLDEAIVSEFEEILGARGVSLDDLPDPRLARAYLRRAATEAKLALTDSRDTEVVVGYGGGTIPPMHYSAEQLEEALRPQLDRAWDLILSTLRASYLTRDRGAVPSKLRKMTDEELTKPITHVLLAGGMSLIPAVGRYLAKRFPNAKLREMPRNTAQEAICTGLAENESYAQVNLNRPAFNFVIDFERDGARDSVTLYEAYTRFYAPNQAFVTDRLEYRWSDGATASRPGTHRLLPSRGQGSLAVYALDGSLVPLRLDGQSYDSMRVAFGHRDTSFSLSPGGDLTIFDGSGRFQTLRIARWPALSTGFEGLAVPIEEATWVPERRRSWDSK
ncbi:MAG: Hsp70 family protein [Humibacillus sp.]|nr:Hsp70 family protein [Humibacillus sp.]MDN5775635.1 Hsp70 family protein [Humibacillus sp.]